MKMDKKKSLTICHLVAIVGTGTALKEYGVGEA
jgi:hypothetical protein